MLNKRCIGSIGEEKAVYFLKKNGYKLLERNYRTKLGEIDVIAEQDNDIVFVEVKLRNSSCFGRAAEAVGLSKQNRIIRSSLGYLKANNIKGKNVRFDVLLIEPNCGSIQIIKSAFTQGGRYTY